MAKSESGELPLYIVGAGIAGLSAAIALAREGLSTTILEKTEAPAAEGAGIQLGPNASRILDDWGVLEKLSKSAVQSQGILIGDGLTGQPLNEVPFGKLGEDAFGGPFLLVHRSDLHEALLKTLHSLKKCTIEYGQELRSFRSDADGLLSLHTGGEPIPARGLISADGLWSAIRHEVDPGAQLDDSRRSAWRALIEASDVPEVLSEPYTRLWIGPGAHLVHYPVKGGKKINLVAVIDDKDARGADGWSRDADPTFMKSVFAPWNAHVTALMEKADNWRCWSLYSMPPLRTWVRDTVCLMGDAAHPTLPFLAQGGAMAIEDAAVLGRLVGTGKAGLADAMKRFELERIERTARTAYESRKMGHIYHMGGVFRLARNQVLRWNKPENLLKRYDWLYGFRAEAP